MIGNKKVKKLLSKYNREEVGVALCGYIERSVIEDKRKKDSKKLSRMLLVGKKALPSLLIAGMCSACTLADPAASGIVVDAQASEIAMAENGKLIITHTYERLPSETGGNAGTVHNRRALSDYFYRSN